MISGAAFLDTLERHDVGFLSGVPCSYFAAPLRLLEDHERLRYVPAINEGSALAMAAGAQLGGVPSAVLAQNSGFGNLINPLTSLLVPYRLPVLVFMSMRGRPESGDDEPQHRLMGQVAPQWLDSIGVPHWTLAEQGPSLTAIMTEAAAALEAGSPAFVLVHKGAIGPPPPTRAPRATADTIGRAELVRALHAELGDHHVLSTTGLLSRAMFGAGDRPQNFYMQGSMGHIGSLALGAALQHPGEQFVVLDGDGALLMHLGSIATIGSALPPNLTHLVFDNGAYESTGAQPNAASPDFAELAAAAGYHTTATVSQASQLRESIRTILASTGPSVLSITGVTGEGPAGPRASDSLDLAVLAQRFRASLRPPTAKPW